MIGDIILAGLPIGCIYAFVALGFSLIYSAVRLLHLAQGDFIMVGAYIGLLFASAYHFPTIPVLLLALVGVAIMAVIIERLAYRPILHSHASNRIICTLAVGIVLKNVVQVLGGTRPQNFPDWILGGAPLILGSRAIGPVYYWTIIISAVTMIALSFLLLKTKVGLAIRATAFNRDLSNLMGINTSFMLSLSFFLGGVLAGIGGILAGKILFIVPAMGFGVGIKGFIAAVLGGWGSLPGAVIGGIGLGLVENWVAGFISSGYKDAITFLILVFFLIFRPSGILGSKEQARS
jgi:branched-chain amino acid transport system permease protein